MPSIHDVLACLAKGEHQRILAFGSSNTERFLPGSHWFDCLELALRAKYGRHHRCINSGVSGNTSTQLLERFERDAAFYQPHAVFITIGGNDANPNRDLSPDRFRENLLTLYRQFDQLGCAVVFQTYYAPNADACTDANRQLVSQLYSYMQIVRDVAEQTGAHLIDHLARWEPFRLAYPRYYLELMRDVMHVNPQGNLVLGLDIARQFDLPLGQNPHPEYWQFACQCQSLMDRAACKAREV